MTDKKLPTTPYKGVRDFYPEDMAIQQYLFDTWSYTAESFGYERYDASILEPADLYRAKGAENAEMVTDQTYTFTDRGDREVTLRPEMTPTVARMIAAKQRELSFPVRWYSIPNLFRYERTQRGRLREHWQLNCDIFGASDYTADVELIALAHQIFMNFGADESMFEILVNNRQTMKTAYEMLGITNDEIVRDITRLNDRKNKISDSEYFETLQKIVGERSLAIEIKAMIESKDTGDNAVVAGLHTLGIKNVRVDRSLARGFDYYTGTIFEIIDTNPENSRSMMGGGRYDHLTTLFSDVPVTGVGFGFGDVTLRNFLESHDLLTANFTGPTLMILPIDKKNNLTGLKVARDFRTGGIAVAVDTSDRKVGKKLDAASKAFVGYVLILGDSEVANSIYTLKNLASGEEITGTTEEILANFED